jgi:N-acetylneuraminate lyase
MRRGHATMTATRQRIAPLLDGLVAAVFTPFDARGALDLAPIEPYAALLVRNRIRGVFVCGTTGEGVSMTIDERMACLERWRAVAPRAERAMKVVAHVGHQSLPEAQRLARHAEASGADAIATVGPSVLKPASLDDLVAWCAAVARAAPETPYYYYHIPVLTGLRFDMRRFVDRAAGAIPTLAGIKFTDENLMEFGECVDAGRWNMLWGRDEILLAGLATGADGAIGSSFNYSAPVYNYVLDAFAAGDTATAMREMKRVRASIRALIDFGGLPAGKAMLRRAGIDCGPVRLPLVDLPAERVAAMHAALDAAEWDAIRCR